MVPLNYLERLSSCTGKLIGRQSHMPIFGHSFITVSAVSRLMMTTLMFFFLGLIAIEMSEKKVSNYLKPFGHYGGFCENWLSVSRKLAKIGQNWPF